MDAVLSFDPIRILRQLHADGVEYVLIGGIAGRVHGSPTVTNDLNICYRRTRENCARLVATLHALDARLRDLPDELSAPVDTSMLWQGHNFTFVTTAGRARGARWVGGAWCARQDSNLRPLAPEASALSN